jgi:excinuclease ABC subunit B
VSSGFRLVSPFEPQGDQPQAIAALVDGLVRGEREQTLLGVTGSGKTFTIAKMIETANRPALVLSHNKTLAAQLYQEFRAFFPHNAVEYFVSYYDYYQPEAYVPQSDTYIEKEATINEEIDRLRLRATKALFERRDVIVVASVSCIYGLGSPEFYGHAGILRGGETTGIDRANARLAEMQYTRTPLDLFHGAFRVRGDVLEILPFVRGPRHPRRVLRRRDRAHRRLRPPARRGARGGRPRRRLPEDALRDPQGAPRERPVTIREELGERLAELEAESKLVEHQRLEQRTRFDLEMLKEVGYCQASRTTRATSRAARPASRRRRSSTTSRGLRAHRRREPPDGSRRWRHVPRRPLAQADAGRVRLPPALGARQPTAHLRGVRARVKQRSTSPRPRTVRARALAGGVVVEQLIRPTGLLDPEIELRPARGQVDDLLGEIRVRVERKGERVLVTTLTKRMAEELTQYFLEVGVRVRYLHSDIETLERIAIVLRDLRRGESRRARRHQPPARGARPARGLARRGARRRPGGLPAQRHLADPDRRPRGAQPGRTGDPLRRPRDRLDPEDGGRDTAPPRPPGGLQP